MLLLSIIDQTYARPFIHFKYAFIILEITTLIIGDNFHEYVMYVIQTSRNFVIVTVMKLDYHDRIDKVSNKLENIHRNYEY